MAMIKPVMMGICEVNDWGQAWEQMKELAGLRADGAVTVNGGSRCVERAEVVRKGGMLSRNPSL